MAHSNGKITAPVSISDINLTIGSGSNDLGTLCQSKLINRWSARKPVIYDSPFEINDTQMRFTNYGFDMNYAAGIYIPDLFNRAIENPNWVYLHPQNGNWHRMLDFNGYNHNAVEPFSYRSFPTELETLNDTASAEFRILKNTNAEIEMTNLAYFDGNQSAFRYAIAIRKQGGQSQDVSIYLGPTIGEAGNEIFVTVNFPSTGTWELLFIATRETTTEPVFIDSVYMPLGYHTIKVTKKLEYALVTVTNSFNLTLNSTGVITGFNLVNLSIKAMSPSFRETTGDFKVHCYCYDENNIIGDFLVTDIDGMGNFTYSGTDIKTYSLNFLLGSSIVIGNYNPDINVNHVKRVELRPEIETIRGNGFFAFDKEYVWSVTKS